MISSHKITTIPPGGGTNAAGRAGNERNLLAGLEAPIHGSRGALHTTLDNRLKALRPIGIDRDTPIITGMSAHVEDPTQP